MKKTHLDYLFEEIEKTFKKFDSDKNHSKDAVEILNIDLKKIVNDFLQCSTGNEQN